MKIQLLRPKKINDGFAVTGQKLEGSVGRKFFFFFFFLGTEPVSILQNDFDIASSSSKKKKKKRKENPG